MNEPMEVAFAPDRLAVLLKHFAELNDERESWRVAYPLKEVLLLVTWPRSPPATTSTRSSFGASTTSISYAASVTSLTACRAPAGCAI